MAIERLAKLGNYVPYYRRVNASRLYNGKAKGNGNPQKNGNNFLSTAYGNPKEFYPESVFYAENMLYMMLCDDYQRE